VIVADIEQAALATENYKTLPKRDYFEEFLVFLSSSLPFMSI
jgi:hypothetical protein